MQQNGCLKKINKNARFKNGFKIIYFLQLFQQLISYNLCAMGERCYLLFPDHYPLP